MTDSATFGITRDGPRVIVIGDVRTNADRDALKDQVAHALTYRAARLLEYSDRLDVVLDVAGAGYLDTASLVTLLAIARKCSEAGCALVLAGASPELLKLLRVTHIDEVLVGRGSRITPAGA